MFGWLKKPSQASVAGSDPANGASRDSSSQARGRFRLEPLEPRVLLSGDSIIAVVALQTLQDAHANGAADAPAAIVEQLDAGPAAQFAAADRGQDPGAATGVKTSVAWPAGWQPSAASGAKNDAETAVVGKQESQLEDAATADSATPQATQLEQVKADVAAQDKSADANGSAAVGMAGDDQVVTSPDTTQQPRGPPAESVPSAVVIAAEAFNNNDLKPTASAASDDGVVFAFDDRLSSEPNADSLPRGPPVGETSLASQPQYLRGDPSAAAPAQNSLSGLTDEALKRILCRSSSTWVAAQVLRLARQGSLAYRGSARQGIGVRRAG